MRRDRVLPALAILGVAPPSRRGAQVQQPAAEQGDQAVKADAHAVEQNGVTVSSGGCQAVQLPVSAGQAAHDTHWRRQARYGIVTLIWPDSALRPRQQTPYARTGEVWQGLPAPLRRIDGQPAVRARTRQNAALPALILSMNSPMTTGSGLRGWWLASAR